MIHWNQGSSIYRFFFSVPHSYSRQTEESGCWIEATSRKNKASQPLLGRPLTECILTEFKSFFKGLFIYFNNVPQSACSFKLFKDNQSYKKKKHVEDYVLIGAKKKKTCCSIMRLDTKKQNKKRWHLWKETISCFHQIGALLHNQLLSIMHSCPFKILNAFLFKVSIITHLHFLGFGLFNEVLEGNLVKVKQKQSSLVSFITMWLYRAWRISD